MATHQSYDGTDSPLNREARASAGVVRVDLARLLLEIEEALRQAEVETRDEIDGLPRNLLAAFERVCRHTDYFLRVTNASLNCVECDESVHGRVRLLRSEVAVLVMEIGDKLRCSEGFLKYEALDAEESECKKLLKDAAPLISDLAEAFKKTRDDILVDLPGEISGKNDESILPGGDAGV